MRRRNAANLNPAGSPSLLKPLYGSDKLKFTAHFYDDIIERYKIMATYTAQQGDAKSTHHSNSPWMILNFV
jgi:hypothetical protein